MSGEWYRGINYFIKARKVQAKLKKERVMSESELKQFIRSAWNLKYKSKEIDMFLRQLIYDDYVLKVENEGRGRGRKGNYYFVGGKDLTKVI